MNAGGPLTDCDWGQLQHGFCKCEMIAAAATALLGWEESQVHIRARQGLSTCSQASGLGPQFRLKTISMCFIPSNFS